MAETVLVNAATVTAGATSSVVAYHIYESPFVDFRVECDQSHSVRFYVANVDFDAVSEAGILTGATRTGVAATTGEGDVYAAVDLGSYDYIACVVTNDGVASATVTIAADYDVAPTPSSLVSLVSNELENHAASGSWDAVGDGTTTSFTVAPLARYIVDDATWAVEASGAPTTAFTMDFNSGVITFDAAPALSVPLTAKFNHVYWTDELVSQAVNAGINNVFPFFYNPTTEVLGATVEHTFATAGAEVVTMVVTTGSTVTKIKRNKYTTYKNGDNLVLRWYGAAPSGTIRAHIICRPAMVNNVLNVTDRATAPIVSYSIYHLLSQKQAARIRSDIAIVTVGQGNLSPRQMNDASNSFFLRYQAQCQQSKQLPWSMS